VTSNNKQVTLLTNPLNKIQAATEATAAILMELSTVIVGFNTYSVDTIKELKKQTDVLLDIKSLLKEQARQGSGGSGGKTKMPGIVGAAKTAVAIVIMAGALVAASGILGYMQPVTAIQMLTALAVGYLFVLLVPVFVKISEAFKGPGLTDRIIGKVAGVGARSQPSMGKMLAGVGLAMVIMAAGTAASSHILALVKPITLAQFATAALIGISFVFLAISFGQITKTLRRNRISADRKGIMRLGMVSASMVAIALGVVGVAYAFMLMPSNPPAPDLGWTFRAAAAIGLFAIGFNFIMKAIKRASLKDIIFGALAIPAMAVAIVGVAYAFMLMPENPGSPDALWTLKSAFAIGLFAIGFFFIMKAIKRASLKDIIFGALAIPAMALAIVGVAFIFGMLGDVSNWVAPPAMWTLKAGFALLIFAIPFYIVSKAIKGMNAKRLLFMAAALPVVAFGVLAAAWIFQALPDVYKAPEAEWTLKAGLAMVIFGAAIYLSSKTIGRMGMGDLFKALIGVVVASFAIIAVGWILSLGPSTWIAPPLDWSIAVAAALGVIGGAIVVMGIAVTALTPVTLLLGALGIIVAAITILAVGWILSGLAPVMPSLVKVAQGFTAMLLAPVNGMVDVFARFKNEIGVDNMIGLAIGIAALGGAWLIFTAAMAGASIASGIGNAIGGILDGIGSLFGGDKPSPIEILERLAVIAPEVQKLARPLINVGKGFSMINRGALGAMSAFTALIELHEDIDVDDFKDQAKSFNSIAKSYNKIAHASKMMDIKALYATTNMFKALDDLAKNGGASAMGVLADKLMEAVKQLSGTVTNLEKSVEKQGKATSGIGDALSGAIDTVKETVTGVKKNVDAMNKDTKDAKLDIQPLIDAIQDLETRFDRAIKVIQVEA
jgi:hypothetical protein